jgi:hypothetical protein
MSRFFDSCRKNIFLTLYCDHTIFSCLTTITYNLIPLHFLLSVSLTTYYTGISKIILVKGGHGLENVRLNLLSVTISSVRTIVLPAPFLSVTESVSQNTPTQFVRHA